MTTRNCGHVSNTILEFQCETCGIEFQVPGSVDWFRVDGATELDYQTDDEHTDRCPNDDTMATAFPEHDVTFLGTEE